MAEPEEIISILKKELGEEGTLLKNKKVVITAGPTYEAIDPVRFVGNHSTGKMGICLAELAAKRGADVVLILGPTLLKPIIGSIKVINVVSAEQMYEAFQQHTAQLDIAIFSAAVADYKPENPATQKIKKKTDDFQIQLVKTIDIAAEFGKIKKPNQLSVGFALETENETDNASKNMMAKKTPLISKLHLLLPEFVVPISSLVIALPPKLPKSLPSAVPLLSANRAFHKLLVGGVPVQYQRDGDTRGDFVRLIDWAQPDRNEWLAVNQFSIRGPHHTRRPAPTPAMAPPCP